MLPPDMPVLSNAQVTLRAFRDDDIALVLSVAKDPLIPLISTVSTSGTAEEALAYIHRQHERLRQGAGYSFAIEDKESGRAAGQIGLWLRGIEEGRAATGYWLAPDFRGRGLGKAALSCLAEWALSLDEVDRLELYVEPWNEASWRSAEACGFTREGLLRSWQRVGTKRRDMYVYSRLAVEPATHIAHGTALETARLSLRPLTPEDAGTMRELWSERDPRIPPHRRIDAEGHPTLEEVREQLQQRPGEGIGLLAVEVRDSADVVGYCGLVDTDCGADGEPEIAFELLRRVQGQGYATEAATALIGLARRAGHRRLWATAWDWNSASRRVLAKLGFEEVGIESDVAGRGTSLVTRLDLAPDDGAAG